MDKFPQELLFALIFGAVMLVQFLLKHLRKRGPLTEAEAEAEVEVEAEVEEGTAPDSVAGRPGAAEVPLPVQALPARLAPARPRAAPASARRETRRFSRRSLMGSRRAVQDGVVIAAILGPCRAYRPHDID
ncbi:MAG: hypothetical protein AMXMBFR66_02830 [Pseudomonadota bacterium]|jgi:hypothetical protein